MVLLLVLAGCGLVGNRPRPASPVAGSGAVVVASFDFGESRVLGEIFAQALSARGVPVRRAIGLGSREVVMPALEQARVDVVPEYVGSALTFLTPERPATQDLADSYVRLGVALADRGVVLLRSSPAQNQNALAVTRVQARRLGLRRVSDLRPVAAKLSLGGPPECPERPLCLPGLQQTYGLRFRLFAGLDGGPLTVGALEGGEIDVGVLFTTSPAVRAKDFVLLEDDRRLQPAENVVPAVRREVLRRFGSRLTATLDAVTARLRTEELVELNWQVDLEGRSPASAAGAWLRAEGLVG
jgi:osmoprotectant transport system substrate-binding protein